MTAFSPPFVSSDFLGPGLNLRDRRIISFLDYLERRLRSLRLPRRSTWPLLRSLVQMWLQSAERSPTGAMWAKPSQKALGTLLRHRWGEISRPLDRCTVNRLCRLLESKHVLRVSRRGKAAYGQGSPGHGWQLSNLYEPGAWIWQAWRQWCIYSATSLHGFRTTGLPEIFRRVVLWASRHLHGVTFSSDHCVLPQRKAGDGGGSTQEPPPPPSPPPEPASFEHPPPNV